jgi:hypothetical protein
MTITRRTSGITTGQKTYHSKDTSWPYIFKYWLLLQLDFLVKLDVQGRPWIEKRGTLLKLLIQQYIQNKNRIHDFSYHTGSLFTKCPVMAAYSCYDRLGLLDSVTCNIMRDVIIQYK